MLKSPEEVEQLAVELADRLGLNAPPDLSLNVPRLKFPTGRALAEAARELGEALDAGEVRQ